MSKIYYLCLNQYTLCVEPKISKFTLFMYILITDSKSHTYSLIYVFTYLQNYIFSEKTTFG